MAGKRSRIFDFFKRSKKFTIVDTSVEGEELKEEILFRAVDHAENQEIMEAMDEFRMQVREKMDTPKRREETRIALTEMTMDNLIEMVIIFEKPTAQSVADLAPKPPTEKKEGEAEAEDVKEEGKKAEDSEEKHENDVMVSWENDRRGYLKSKDKDFLITTLLERQIQMQIASATTNRFAELAIVKMARDPQTGERLFSDDPKKDNYIGGLMPETRKILFDYLSEFTQSFNAKNVRKAAEEGAFLESGSSEKSSENSPGEIPVKSGGSRSK